MVAAETVATPSAKKTDLPLGGTALLDGHARPWEQRLCEKSSSYAAGAGPLIADRATAQQIRAEYASLEFRTVSEACAQDFPQDVAGQRVLVGVLYDAIVNMDGILEKRRPISLKKGNDGTASRARPPRRNPGTGDDAADGNGNDNDNTSERIAKTETEDDTAEPATPPTCGAKAKESITITKSKNLSRIEVEMLAWEILASLASLGASRKA